MFASSFVCLKESGSIIEMSHFRTGVFWFGNVDLDGIVMRTSYRSFDKFKHLMLFEKNEPRRGNKVQLPSEDLLFQVATSKCYESDT